MVHDGLILKNDFRSLVHNGRNFKNAGLNFFVDSAGMISYHAGEHPDERSIEVAKQNGIDISGQVARMITKNDFENFFHIPIFNRYNLPSLND